MNPNDQNITGCPQCNGTGVVQIRTTSTWDSQKCKKCNGTGKQNITELVKELQKLHAKWKLMYRGKNYTMQYVFQKVGRTLLEAKPDMIPAICAAFLANEEKVKALEKEQIVLMNEQTETYKRYLKETKERDEKLRIAVEALEKIASTDYAERCSWSDHETETTGYPHNADDFYGQTANRALAILRPLPHQPMPSHQSQEAINYATHSEKEGATGITSTCRNCDRRFPLKNLKPYLHTPHGRIENALCSECFDELYPDTDNPSLVAFGTSPTL